MAEIAFALITSENLKKYGAFHIKQVETVVDIPASLDSSTQQSIRDQISPAFIKMRNELNAHILDMRGQIEKALQAGKSQKDLKKALEKDITTRVEKIDSLLAKAVPVLLKRDAELDRLIGQSLLKLKVNSTWKVGSLIWEGIEVGTEVGKAVVSGQVESWLGTVRGCIGLVKSICATIEAIEDATSEEANLRKQLKPKLKELKKLKPPAKVPSALVDEIERLLRTYPLRIAEVQQSVKPLAGQLDKLLTATEKAKFPDSKRQKAVEASIQKLINKVIHLNVYSDSGKKLAAGAKEAAAEAKSRRATDWNRVWGTISEYYDTFCDLESKMEIDSIAGALQDIGEEMLDDWLELEDEFD